MEFNEVLNLLNQEIAWAETEGKNLNIVSGEYHNGYVAGLNQAKLLLAVQSLSTDDFLRLYGYNPDEIGRMGAEIADCALEAAYNKSLQGTAQAGTPPQD